MTEAGPPSIKLKEVSSRSFEAAMEDDFNTPKAIAAIFSLINKGNSLIAKNKLSKSEAKEILQFLKKVDKVFNFIFLEKPKEKIPKGILKLVEERETQRKNKEWEGADKTRNKIKKLGYLVEDTKEGTKIKNI